MADRRSVQANIATVRRVKTWQLLLLLVLGCVVSATFLRLNNIGMSQRYEAVISADKTGDQSAVHNRLLDLQRYVSAHMNADMGWLYLEEQYKRDSKAVVDNAVKASRANANNDVINAKVDAICKPRYTGYSQAYVQCFAEEFAKYSSAKSPVSSVKLPSPDSYRHSFAAPMWSPDFAGFSVLATAVILLIIIIRLIMLAFLKILLKLRYREL